MWAYVVFVVSNAMTPSPADRQPWLVAGIYLAIALAFAWLLGGLSVIDRSMRDGVAGVLQVLTLGFIFSIAVNLAVAANLWVIETVVIGVQRPKRRNVNPLINEKVRWQSRQRTFAYCDTLKIRSCSTFDGRPPGASAGDYASISTILTINKSPKATSREHLVHLCPVKALRRFSSVAVSAPILVA